MSTRLLRALDIVEGAVINTDSDGLLSALVLNFIAIHRGRALPIVGYYDNERLWLTPDIELGALLGSPTRVLFLDADVRIAGAVVVSQHVVHHPAVGALRHPPSGVTLINPNYLEHTASRDYRWKYPFSTLAWIWALVAEAAPLPPLGPATPALTGLLWAQDGGHESVRATNFRENCLEWALTLINGMPLAPAAAALLGMTVEDHVGTHLRDDALIARAIAAEERVRYRAREHLGYEPAPAGWSSQQWTFAARQTEPRVDPSTSSGRREIAAFFEGVRAILDLPVPGLPPVRLVRHGTWNRWDVGQPEPNWSDTFSLARTYRRAVAYTTGFA